MILPLSTPHHTQIDSFTTRTNSTTGGPLRPGGICLVRALCATQQWAASTTELTAVEWRCVIVCVPDWRWVVGDGGKILS